MPLYEYQCKECGKHTEALQHIGDAPLSRCPHCGGSLERLISAPALQFKGTGWYVTDYAKRSASADSKDSASAAPPKTDTKPESKSADKAPASDSKAKAS